MAPCVVALGYKREGDTVMAAQKEVRLVFPRKNKRLQIVGGRYRGSTAKVMGLDRSNGIVRLDDSLDVKIMNLAISAKLVHE